MVYIFLALTDSSKLHALHTSFKLNNILLAKSLVAQLTLPVVFNIDIQDSYPSFSIISIELYKINNKNILLCPRASTNLISVHKLNKDNNRVCCIDSIELDANESIVKEKKKKNTRGLPFSPWEDRERIVSLYFFHISNQQILSCCIP